MSIPSMWILHGSKPQNHATLERMDRCRLRCYQSSIAHRTMRQNAVSQTIRPNASMGQSAMKSANYAIYLKVCPLHPNAFRSTNAFIPHWAESRRFATMAIFAWNVMEIIPLAMPNVVWNTTMIFQNALSTAQTITIFVNYQYANWAKRV